MKNENADKIKVVFLDIDGVLNTNKTTRRTTGGYRFVGSRQLKNLRRIINATQAKVVLSSDWRYDRDDPRYNSDYLELKAELMRYGIQFYGFTPEIPSAHRGAEIAQWLAEHPEVSNFVILDDRTDIEPNKDHWVQTTMSHGLGTAEADEAVKILMKSCMNCVPYVDHIDPSDLRLTPTVEAFVRVVTPEIRDGHKFACVECGAVFEDYDLAFVHEVGECPYCHKQVRALWMTG